MIQIRVAPKAIETFDEIAETLGYSRQEVVYALLMKGLMSLGNWETVGLPVDWQRKMPQFKLPRYEENPTMRKATPAQLAARERFAEMARSGAFKRKKNPMVISKQADDSLSKQGSRGYVRKLLDRYSDEGHVVSVKKTRSGSIGIAFDGGRMLTVASARKKLEDYFGITDTMKRRSNPADRERKPRVVLITNPKQRMGLIAFRTAGGALTTKEVPILFSFKLPVAANLYGEKSTMDFFAHKDGREIAVTEKTTGFKLGNIPRVFMAVGRDEKAAAKYFVEDLLKQHGAAKFRAAVESKPKIA